MADRRVLRVGTLNLASGRGPAGTVLAPAGLRAAVATLDVDVLAVQETDAGQPRSACADQPALVAEALGAGHWRAAAGLSGTPSPLRTWRVLDPPALRGPGEAPDGPEYGIALVSRRPVRAWSVLGLGAGRARLPLRAPDPRTGRIRWWWVPDEPRVALAARLDGLTVVATHLSFAPPTAVRQLRALRRWIAGMPGPVVLAGDLNLPGAVPARLLGATPLVRAPSYPAANPRVQLDHLLAVGSGLSAGAGTTTALAVGDHRALVAEVHPA